ncbi:MAG: hypothetical protein IPG01_00170 [Chitinophagaceae bacterium]|nr:hypothetical protein [Chitinophagaceae bacterium]
MNNNLKDMPYLNWLEVEKFAKYICSGVNDNADIKCGENIWLLLEEFQLTRYQNEIELNRILVRAIAVCHFVNDCSYVICDEDYENSCESWADEAGVDKFRIAQFMGVKFMPNDSCDSEELFENAISELLTSDRNLIISKIRDKYHSDADIMTFLGGFYDPSSEDNIDQEDIDMDPVHIPSETLRFFEWISDGMPELK